MRNRIYLLVCLLSGLAGQNDGQLSGIVLDVNSGEPLAGVNVLIQDSFIGTATDNLGRFLIPDLDPGVYNIVVSMIGYRREIVKNISLENRREQFLEIKLIPDVLVSPQIIVSASRRIQDIMESPLSVAVVGIRQIEAKAAISLVDVLPYYAGVNTIKGQLNIRGASGYTMGAGNRSLLLIDGVPLLGSAAGNITWAVIPTSEISQVEIVRSGGSTLYGSSAMGGVLNIITRNAPSKPETRWISKFGGYSNPKYKQWQWRKEPGLFYTMQLTHARPFGQHSGWLRIQNRHSDGYTQLNWEDSNNITGKIKLNYGRQYSASLYANYLVDSNGLESQWKSPADPFEAPQGDEDNYASGTKLNLNGFFNFIYSPDVVMKVKSSYYNVHWENYGSNTDFSNERKIFGEYQISTNWSRSFNTIAGIVLQKATIDARIFGEHQSFSTALYLLAQRRLQKHLLLSAGIRGENYHVDGDVLDQTVAPQFAVNWNCREWLALRTSVSRGFRVPTVAELFSHSQLNVFKVRPNPDLVAETSLSYEIGSTIILPDLMGLSNIMIDAALFSSTYENLIEPTPDELGIIHFENITNARISGAEVGLNGALLHNRLLFTTAYTWLDPVEIDSSSEIIDTLSYRFRHTVVTTTTYRRQRFTVSLEYRFSSRMENVELFDEKKVTGSDRRVPLRLWNANLSYSFKGWEFLLRGENLFQYYYVELERNMGEERNFSLTVTKNL